MPSFTEFDYYFAIDKLDIPASWIALQFIWVGVFILITPLLYVFRFRDTEYYNLFFFSQALYVYSFVGKLALA